MKRRHLLAGAAAVGLVRSAGAVVKPPNIVFILADDLAYADISRTGRPDVRTPHIDSIAARGAFFPQAYCASPVCTVSRTAIITGRYPLRERIGLEEPLNGTTPKDVGLPPSRPTLPSLLRKAGYHTSLIGKWHLGNLPDFGPLKSGYDSFYGFRAGAIDYFNYTNTGGKPDFWENDTLITPKGYATTLFGDRAVTEIDRSATSGKPFFLSLHFNAPHWPWEGPDDQAESERLGGKTLFHFDGGDQATYRRMITALDQQVGRVLAALERAGVANNTIVVFTSDNGAERYGDTWPFTGNKTELLEGGLRVPAMIAWPGHIKAGSTCAQVTMNFDWMPTLLAAAGTAPDPASPPDGINLLPALTAGAMPVPRTFYWRYKAYYQHAVRDGDLKYVKLLDNEFLFNVVADPMERADLKARQPETFTRLKAQWAAWSATMMPETLDSNTEGFSGDRYPNHIGLKPASREPDPSLK